MFYGDIGSKDCCFWIIALLALLILRARHWYVLFFQFMVQFGCSNHHLRKIEIKENIFEAHRRTSLSAFSNEKKFHI